MWHVGIDLHLRTAVIAAVNDLGEAIAPVTIPCEDTPAIVETFKKLGAFRAVIEATGTYRWLYDLLRPFGSILLAHPLRLRAMIQRRSKKATRDDAGLKNFYQRIRKRSSAKIARVATARKLAEICWKRLRRWHRQRVAQVA
jgi:hypothetical protein